METEKKVNLAIITPLRSKYSETFIQNHINRLDHVRDIFYEGLMPLKSDRKGELLPYNTASVYIKGLIKLKQKIMGVPLSELQRRAFERQLKRQKVNVVLAEYGTTAASILPTIEKLGIALIVHFHGFDAYNHSVIKQYAQAYRRMFNYAHKIIVVSRHMKDQIIGLGADRDKVVVNIYGVDTTKFNVGSEIRDQLFVSVGRFVDKKAPFLSIMAFNEFRKTNSGYRLIMIGDGPLLDMCKTLSKSLGIEDNVEFTGRLSHENIKTYLQRATAYIQHSVRAPSGDAEGTPNSILEAMASATPIISTKHTGIPGVVENGQSGLLVEELDYRGMALNMVRLAKNSKLARQLGNHGKDVIHKNYQLWQSLSKLNMLIEGAIK